jgi:hypothetical protein
MKDEASKLKRAIRNAKRPYSNAPYPTSLREKAITYIAEQRAAGGSWCSIADELRITTKTDSDYEPVRTAVATQSGRPLRAVTDSSERSDAEWIGFYPQRREALRIKSYPLRVEVSARDAGSGALLFSD